MLSCSILKSKFMQFPWQPCIDHHPSYHHQLLCFGMLAGNSGKAVTLACSDLTFDFLSLLVCLEEIIFNNKINILILLV